MQDFALAAIVLFVMIFLFGIAFLIIQVVDIDDIPGSDTPIADKSRLDVDDMPDQDVSIAGESSPDEDKAVKKGKKGKKGDLLGPAIIINQYRSSRRAILGF